VTARLALVTGAAGEMGHLLIPELERRGFEIVTVDLRDIPPELAARCRENVHASITDHERMDGLFAEHRFSHVYHLAAILSSKAEREPELAHRVNVEGTLGLFRRCLESVGDSDGPAPVFVFPSSIAVYGLPDARTKKKAGSVKETEWLVPSGIYGCNKLYCELIGSHMTRHSGLDFRSIRFPGLISAETLPTGGTTDYGPEMIHAAAQGKPYACFVREDSRLPFMTMPDGVAALLRLAEADAGSLSTRVYNIRAFSVSAAELRDRVVALFPDAQITFDPQPARQAIVDSWPEDTDDSLARRDWGLTAEHGFPEAIDGYVAPALRSRYAEGTRAES
jgi:nucleoside-diphosphate-sugar epimerase